MGITKPVEDLVPRRKFTHPNPKAGTQVSANHGYSNTCKNIYLLLHAYLACAETEVMLGSFHCGLWDLWSQHRERRGRMETRKEEQKESGERQEQTNKTNLVKPSAGLGPGLKCVCVCVCEEMWTEWQGLGQILGCPTHSWLMIQSWSAAQRTSRHGTPGCVHASVCVSVSVCVCVYRHVDSTDVRVSVHICRHAVVQTSVCVSGVWVCTYVCVYQKRKVGLSEIKQRLSVLHVPCLKAGCDHLGHERRTEWKTGLSKLHRENQRAAFQGWSYKCLPASPLWISHSYSLTTHTNTFTQTSPLQLQRLMLSGSVVNNKRGQSEAWLRMNYT